MEVAKEKELVKQYRQGNEQAQKELIESLTNLIHFVINHEIKTGMSYPSDRDDLYQEGLMALDRAIRTYDTESGVPLGGYAYIFIKRQIRNYTRKNNRLYERKNVLSLDRAFSEDNPHTMMQMVAEPLQENRNAEEVLSHLPAQEKEIIRLRLQGYKYKEIATKLQIPEKKVDNTVYRIKQRLEKKREKEESLMENGSLPKCLSKREMQLYLYRQKGYRNSEIAALMHMEAEEVTKEIRKIRRKLRNEAAAQEKVKEN